MQQDFHGLPTGILENSFLRIEYLKNAGPRIVRIFFAGSTSNPLAEMPGLRTNTVHGEFSLQGGHRLWRAPESLDETYIPDNEGLLVDAAADRVQLSMPADKGFGIAKSITLQLASDRAAVTLEHEMCNQSGAPIRMAAWALTMFQQGGTVILPQAQGQSDAAGLLSNRHLVLWPYTRWNDRRLVLGDETILIRAQSTLPPLKIGYFNPHGWIGYWREGLLFVKRFDVTPDVPHPDRDCNTESYCNNQFVELETLGPLNEVPQGGCVRHTETWEFYDSLDQPFISPALREQIRG